MIKQLFLATILVVACHLDAATLLDKEKAALLSKEKIASIPVLKPQQLHNIDDLATMYANLVGTLVEQPLHPRRDGLLSKFIFVETYEDARICDILSNHIEKQDSIQDWSITAFFAHTAPFVCPDHCKEPTPAGLHMSNIFAAKFSMNIFQKCTTLITLVKSGWRKSTLAENPGIAHKKPEEQFDLFIKTATLIGEARLISFLIKKFGMEQNEKAYCYDGRHSPEEIFPLQGTLYLQIDKNYRTEFKQKFCFEIPK